MTTESTNATQSDPVPSMETYNENARHLQAFFESQQRQDSGQLIGVIQQIAQNGLNCYNWTHLQQLLAFKIQQLSENFTGDKTFSSTEVKDSLMTNIMNDLESFKQAPFTLQRLCELLSEPNKYYRKLERVLLSIEKCLNVRTTLPIENVEEISIKESDETVDAQMSDSNDNNSEVETNGNSEEMDFEG